MRKYIISLVLSLLLGFMSLSCQKETDPPGIRPIELDNKAIALLESENTFAFNIFREVVKEEEGSKNLMISPLSISLALAMTYNGSDGETKVAMEDAMSLQGLSPEEINKSYHTLIQALLSVDPRVVMEIASSIWYRQGFSVEQEFLDINKEYYEAEVSSLDFGNPASVNVINNWVSDATHDKIDNIINVIEPLDVMFLINAIYFKGDWKYRFDESATMDSPFYDGTGTLLNEVPTMVVEGGFNYMSHEHFEAIELPYGQGNYQMIVMLPKEGSSVDEVLNDMSDTNWNLWMDGFHVVPEIKVHLPRFKFEYEEELKDILSHLGMGIAFTSQADFTGINAQGGLLISSVKHKTFIEVNEEGTEAAAATSVTVSLTSIGEEQYFIVNRPFIFVIREQYTGAITFMGLVTDPDS